MKKLSKTQQELMNKLTNVIKVIRKYDNYEDFFDNSKYEQSTFKTAIHCNACYNNSEKYKSRDLEDWEENRKAYELCKTDAILITFAKTETLKALEKYGLIKIIKEAEYNGGAEIVKVLNI